MSKLKKHTLNLTDGACDVLQRLFPEKETSTVVREVIDMFIEREKMKTKSHTPKLKEDIEL